MRFDLDKDSPKAAQLQMVLSHDDKKIYWNIAAFDKKTFTEPEYDVFKHINEYWARMDSYKQELIFLTYDKIRSTFEDVSDTSSLIQHLHPLIHELLEEHKLNDVSTWMAFHSDITFGYKLDDIYVESDEKPGSREKTYLKSDYILLLAMTIVLRTMIPVWGEFIYRTKRETGPAFKELYAFQLLSQSYMMYSPPMDKLRVYVNNNILEDKPLYSSIIKGVGSEDYPTWLLSKVIVCKLCIGDVSGSKDASLVTLIWNFINHKVINPNTGSFASMIKGKEFEPHDSTNEHNTSRLEGYKIKTELPLGDIVILEHYMNDPVAVAQKLKPGVNVNLLMRFLEMSNVLQTEQIWKPQVALAQYVMKPVISPRGLIHLSKKQVITAIAITQTLLWESNHKTLACLASAIATYNEHGVTAVGIDSRTRIPKELMDELNMLFPYNKINSLKRKSKAANTIISAIDEVASLFSQRDWVLTVGDEFMAEVTDRGTNRRLSCPHDIKVLLTRLIIELVKSR